MMAEHILYTAAIIIIIGIYYTRYTGKHYYWGIIFISSFLADLDHFNNIFWDAGLVPWGVELVPFIKIGLFHNVLWLVIMSALIAFLLLKYKQIPVYDTLIFCGIGYSVHLLEDFISYPPVYHFLYPLSSEPFGINLIPETKDLIWAGSDVLNIGLILLAFAIIWYEVDLLQSESDRITDDEP